MRGYIRLLLKHLIIVNPRSEVAKDLILKNDTFDLYDETTLAQIKKLSKEYNVKVKDEPSVERQQRRAIVAAEICYEALQYCLPGIGELRWTKWNGQPEMNAKEFILNNSKKHIDDDNYKFVQQTFLPKYIQHLERALLFITKKERPENMKTMPEEPLSRIMEAFQKALLNRVIGVDKKPIKAEIKSQSAYYTSLIKKKWERMENLEQRIAMDKDD